MNYEEMSDDDLRTELQGRQLATTGSKDDLVARLELHDAESAEGTDEGPGPDEGSDDEGQDDGAVREFRDDPSKPAQSQDRVQDKAIRGKVVDERGNVIRRK